MYLRILFTVLLVFISTHLFAQAGPPPPPPAPATPIPWGNPFIYIGVLASYFLLRKLLKKNR